MNKTISFLVAALCTATIVLFPGLPGVAKEPSATYEARNVDFSSEGVRVARSGFPIFRGDFSRSEAWGDIKNYRQKLELSFGEGDPESPELVVWRFKPIGKGELETRDTAWSVATDVTPLEPWARDRDFILRMKTRSSKSCRGSGNDGPVWRGALTWFDGWGEPIESIPFLFHSDPSPAEIRLEGRTPDAAGFSIRIGFDVPNIDPGEFVAVSDLVLEIVDPKRPYNDSGEFLSGICRGPANFTAHFEGSRKTESSIDFYVAEEFDGAPGEFEKTNVQLRFVGNSGSVSTSIDAPFFRYRITLIPDGANSPTLTRVKVGDSVATRWTSEGDFKAPRARLVGDRATPNPDPRGRVAFMIEDASWVAPNSVEVLIDGEDATDRFAQVKPGALPLAFEEQGSTNYSPGLHKVVVTSSDVYGNRVDSTRYFLVGEPTATPVVTLREDGMTLIDGEPFFPIGIYGVMEREFNNNDIDEAFRGLKEAGFNFAHSYSMAREDRFLKAAEKYGIKLWSVARFPDERFVEVERFSPAILAWYLGDDTSNFMTPEELDDYFFSVKAVDPTRVTTQADPIAALSHVSNYRPYVAGTDVFMPEIYPVFGKEGEADDDCVAQAIRDVKRAQRDALEADDGPKAVWPIIQYFQGWSGWRRFPTYQELRAMSYAAIASGANGITWYTYGGTVEPEKEQFNYGVTSTPERWKNISTIATEIGELSPILLQPTEPEAQPRVRVMSGPEVNKFGEPTVVCLFKTFERNGYLIAVNASPEEIVARFDFPTPYSERPTTLFEEKERPQARIVNGAVVNKFEPFGVRVWRLAPR
ncbi:MAG: hypothetical protein ACOX0A_06645 [Thermoguttaceae bacterium]|jgi:hypothetical protein